MMNWDWLTDERLYYGGLLLAVIAIVIFFVYFITSRTAIAHLKKQLTREYGDKIRIHR